MRWSRKTIGPLLCVSIALVLTLVAVARADAAKLVGEWRLDEGAGQVVHDSSASRVDGRFIGGDTPSWIPGVEGTALEFDGDDGGVRLDTSSRLEPETVTIAAWVRHDGSPGAYRYIFSKGSASCYRSSYGLYTGTRGGAAFYVAGDGAYTVSPQAAASVIWDGRWHRLTGTYDGTNVRLYVDGEQVRDGVVGPTHIEYGLPSRQAYIGTYHGDCDLPFHGSIDTLRIWDGPLTTAQIVDDAAPPTDPSPPPPPPPPGSTAPPVGGAPGRKPVSTGSAAGSTITPRGCVSLRLSRHSVRIKRRARVVVTVRRGVRRLSRARVTVTAHKLRKRLRTNTRGRTRFVVRATRGQHRLTVRVKSQRPAGCGRPRAFIRVRR